MSVRPEIAALIADGHTDTAIAHRLGISRVTVNRARNQIRGGTQHQMQRLALEAVPTGHALRRRDWTPEEQAAHRAELLAALTAA